MGSSAVLGLELVLLPEMRIQGLEGLAETWLDTSRTAGGHHNQNYMGNRNTGFVGMGNSIELDGEILVEDLDHRLEVEHLPGILER